MVGLRIADVGIGHGGCMGGVISNIGVRKAQRDAGLGIEGVGVGHAGCTWA